MTQISTKHLITSAAVVDAATEEELDTIVERYALQQPFLMAHLISSETDFGNEDATGLIIYHFAVVMTAVEKAKISLDQIGPPQIETFQEAYLEELDHYIETEDMTEMSEFLGQTELMTFILTDLKAREDSGEFEDAEDLVHNAMTVLLGMTGLIHRAMKT